MRCTAQNDMSPNAAGCLIHSTGQALDFVRKRWLSQAAIMSAIEASSSESSHGTGIQHLHRPESASASRRDYKPSSFNAEEWTFARAVLIHEIGLRFASVESCRIDVRAQKHLMKK